MRNNIDSTFKYFFDDLYVGKSHSLTETDDYILFSVTAPGQDKSKMKIQLKGNNLFVIVPEQRPKKYAIPNTVNQTDIKAEYVDGILKIRLGKKDIIKRDIEIK